MHAVELQNPEVLKAANEFLLKRGAGKTPQSLKKLTGQSGYGPTEVVLEDDWKKRGGDVYSGKVYSTGGNLRPTEILTMGIERLHQNPIEFFQRDREYYEFVVKTLRNL